MFFVYLAVSTFSFNFGVAFPKIADLRWGDDRDPGLLSRIEADAKAWTEARPRLRAYCLFQEAATVAASSPPVTTTASSASAPNTNGGLSRAAPRATSPRSPRLSPKKSVSTPPPAASSAPRVASP
jgi:hypothetical protein